MYSTIKLPHFYLTCTREIVKCTRFSRVLSLTSARAPAWNKEFYHLLQIFHMDTPTAGLESNSMHPIGKLTLCIQQFVHNVPGGFGTCMSHMALGGLGKKCFWTQVLIKQSWMKCNSRAACASQDTAIEMNENANRKLTSGVIDQKSNILLPWFTLYQERASSCHCT